MRKRVSSIGKKVTVVLGMTFSMCLLAGCKEKSVKIDDLVQYEVIGLNNYAFLEAKISDTKSDELYDQLKGKKKENEELKDFLESVELEITDDTDSEFYKNGDKIKLKLIYDEEDAKKAKVVVEQDTMEVEVKDLEDATFIDPFEGLEVTFEGGEQDKKAVYNNDGCSDFVKNCVSFYTSLGGKTNGDTTEVSALVDEEALIENKVMFSQESKDYTISGLCMLPTKLSECCGEAVEDVFRAEVEKSASGHGLTVGKQDVKFAAYSPDYEYDGKAMWEVKNIEYIPMNELLFVSKYEENNSTYMIVWKVSVNLECVADGSVAKVGDTTTADSYVAVHQKNIMFGEGTANFDMAKDSVTKFYDTADKSADGYFGYNAQQVANMRAKGNSADFTAEVGDYPTK